MCTHNMCTHIMASYILDQTSAYKIRQKQSIYASMEEDREEVEVTTKSLHNNKKQKLKSRQAKAGEGPNQWVLCTYSSWGSSCGLGGRVGSSVVHDVSPRTAADYLTPRQIHAHSSTAPSSIVGHAMRCHHSGHLG